MIGQILRRRYKVTKELGNGGFGKTYLAEYPCDLPVTPQYHCVIKELIRPSTPDLDTEERFKKEAAVLFKLGKNHSQIPELYDFFEENKKFYLVQEYIEGQDLSYEITSGQQWSEAEVIQLLQEILEVLTFVHEQNVIHRDIKPLNLMRRYSDNKLVLIDFGVVKEISTLEVNTQGQISSTIPIGTRGYMARVKIDNKYGYIDKGGLFIIPPQFDNAWYFYGGLAVVKINNKYSYIDKSGLLIIPLQFDNVSNFYKGLARVRIGEQERYIDKNGRFIY